MKPLARPVIILIILWGVLVSMQPNEAAQDSDDGDRLLRHVVLFKFKDDATEEQIREVEAAFAALPSQIDVIHDFEWGTNNSPEGLEQGFTHCFLVTFRDEAGRAAYLPHEAHQAFVAKLQPILDDVLVVDYWASEQPGT